MKRLIVATGALAFPLVLGGCLGWPTYAAIATVVGGTSTAGVNGIKLWEDVQARVDPRALVLPPQPVPAP